MSTTTPGGVAAAARNTSASSSSSSSQASAAPAGPGPSTTRTRIRFPADAAAAPNDAHARSRTASSGGSSRYSSMGLGPPPVVRNVRASSPADNTGRRVRSVDAPIRTPISPRSPPRAVAMKRRTTADGSPHSRRSKRSSQDLMIAAAAAAAIERSPASKQSDEYDLSNEDPQIIEDVQRALKLKARREARLRAAFAGVLTGQPMGPRSDGESAITSISSSASTSFTPGTLPTAGSLPTTTYTSPVISSTPLPVPNPIVDTDVDFSPTVTSGPQHPVPTSFNDGATLDWSGVTSDDERSEKRGLLSLSKRKWRGKVKNTAGGVVEQSASLYSEKLARIKQNAQTLTLKKAAITADQLSRRYGMLYDGLDTRKHFNPAAVLRWFGNDSHLRESLDQTEPMTWTKHLTDRRPKRAIRLPWHLTAAMAEEHLRSTTHRDVMATIPEHSIFNDVQRANASPSSSPIHRHFATQLPLHATSSSSARTRSRPQSLLSLEPPAQVVRRRRSHEDAVSFEPARRSSPRMSLGSFGQVDSNGVSPNSSRNRLTRFFQRRNDSDDAAGGSAQSSARNSIIEEGPGSDYSEDAVSKRREPSPLPSPLRDTFDNKIIGHDFANNSDASLGVPPTARPSQFTTKGTVAPSPPNKENESTAPVLTVRKDLPRRIMRRSLPPHSKRVVLESRPRTEADEEKEREEYERKAKLVEEAATQNYRIRQVLQRVSLNVKEFDAVQINFAKLLHIPYTPLPEELLEAFNHDPAAVTTHTRRLRGWEAVEDIHARISRQRETVHKYLATAPDHVGIDPPKGRVFGNAVARLLETLTQLEHEQHSLSSRASAVTKQLAEVRTLQNDVKTKYNSAVSHVSAIYPELTQIALLEENYKAQYQQFYDIGMDVIAFLLDIFAPVWRRYGKKIGDDAVDFLLIPWYRNEWTGEAKRYRIAKFPRRSVQHWLALVFIVAIDAALLVSIGEVAVNSARMHVMPTVAHPFLLLILLPIYCAIVTSLWIIVLLCFIVLAFMAAAAIWWFGWSIHIFN